MSQLHPNEYQVGGTHYKEMEVQPWEVMERLMSRQEFIGYLKGNIIKYGMRQGLKDGNDGGKLAHYVAKLDEMQGRVPF
jgi:hypothetical protein